METLSAYSLPPGFGFHPTDVELISHYLKRKIMGLKIDYEVIPEIDIYKHEPWDLPAKCPVPTKDCKWHFFSSRDKKYPTGSRSNRATEAGYWKSTGKDRSIRSHNRVIGTKKTLVFHQGRPPCGKRTDWIMHEYYLDESDCKAGPGMKHSYVLCRITKRDGIALDGENCSPKNEDVVDFRKESKAVAVSVAPEESIPSETIEDFEAWFTELFDPNFLAIPAVTEVKSEPEGTLTSLASKQEPVDAFSCYPRVTEDPNYFLPEVDIDSIIQSNLDNFNAIGDFNIGGIDAADNDFLPFGEHSFVNPSASKVNTGVVEIRERQVRSSAANQNRLRLQLRKMEARNGRAVSQTQTYEINNVHLDPNDEKQPKTESRLLSTGLKSKVNVISKVPTSRNRSAGIFKNLEGIVRSLLDFFSWCTSAGMNCFFLGACMMVTATLICYFLMRDARRFLLSFSGVRFL